MSQHNSVRSQYYCQSRTETNRRLDHRLLITTASSSYCSYYRHTDSETQDRPRATSTNILQARNWRTDAILHRRTADASCSLTRWRHLSACNDVMAAILNVWRQIENPTPSIDAIRPIFNWRTVLPNFIPIQFETTEPYMLFWRGRPNNNKNNTKMSSDMRSVPDLRSRHHHNTVKCKWRIYRFQRLASVTVGCITGSLTSMSWLTVAAMRASGCVSLRVTPTPSTADWPLPPLPLPVLARPVVAVLPRQLDARMCWTTGACRTTGFEAMAVCVEGVGLVIWDFDDEILSLWWWWWWFVDRFTYIWITRLSATWLTQRSMLSTNRQITDIALKIIINKVSK